MSNNCNYVHIVDKNYSSPTIVYPMAEVASMVRSKLNDICQLVEDLKNVKNQKSMNILIDELSRATKETSQFTNSQFAEMIKRIDKANFKLSSVLSKYNEFGKKKRFVVLELVPNNPVEDDLPCAAENVHFKHSIDLNNVSFIPRMDIAASSEKELEQMFAGKYIIPIRCTDCSSGIELIDISKFIEEIFGQKLTNMQLLNDKDLENFKEFGTLTPTTIDDIDDNLTERLIDKAKKELDNDIDDVPTEEMDL